MFSGIIAISTAIGCIPNFINRSFNYEEKRLLHAGYTVWIADHVDGAFGANRSLIIDDSHQFNLLNRGDYFDQKYTRTRFQIRLICQYLFILFIVVTINEHHSIQSSIWHRNCHHHLQSIDSSFKNDRVMIWRVKTIMWSFMRQFVR